ncbi:MAG: DUF420 domain-containing protein [Gemmataceae bacterium]
MPQTLLGLLLAVFILFVSGCNPSHLEGEVPPSLFQEGNTVKDFELTNQLGEKVSSASLQSKIWVVSFFYSTCPDCNKDKHIANMADLAKQLSDITDVVMLSITLNPGKDTPKRLAAFGQLVEADPEKWLLLTGTESEVDRVSQEVFAQGVKRPSLKTASDHLEPKSGTPADGAPEPNTTEPSPSANQIGHSFRMLLVNHEGQIVGYVDARKEQEVARVRERVVGLVQVKRLESGYYFPSLNAGLNALSGLFLLVGYLAIRNRKIALHKVCMLSAVGVSAVFLGCYVYYHFGIRTGEPTRYLGLGWMKTGYFTILLSHTVLAMVVAPLALVTAYLGIRDKLSRHVRVARWTLPLWAYVSVTGVIVYVMLYHL